jgi:DNA-binding CsgD family transcriptional regulator
MFGFAAIALYDVARLGGAGRVLARLRQVVKGVDGRWAPAYLAGASALRARDANALEQVAQQFEAIGALLLAAEAASEAAAAHSAAGDSTRAVAAGTTARALMARCEGAFTPSLGNAVPVAGLTLREREVAALAASGLTSAEIARKLSLSARTVESHLYHSYRKLGVGDRAGLATALRRLAAAGVDPPQSESSVALY